MLKKTVTYEDFNGNERTEDFYFNLSKAELTEMELGKVGGFGLYLGKIIDSKDVVNITKVFKEILLKAYGEKSPDGKRFIKSKELSDAFSQTQAYSDIFVETISNTEAAAAFVNGIMPLEISKQLSPIKTPNETKADSPNYGE